MQPSPGRHPREYEQIDVPIQDQQPRGSSAPASVANSVNTLCGLGILSLPFAFRQSGIVLAITFLLVFGATASCTAMLLRDCISHVRRDRDREAYLAAQQEDQGEQADAEDQPLLRNSVRNHHTTESLVAITYSDVGYAAFGRFGAVLVQTLFSLELFAADTAFIVIAVDALTSLFHDKVYSRSHIQALLVALLTPITMARDLSVLAYASVIGVLACVVISLTVIGYGAHGPASWITPADGVREWPVDAWTAVSAVGIFFVGFDAHSVFPAILHSMQDQGWFNAVLVWAYGYCSVLYVAVGMAGYLMYGSDTQREITLNLAGDSSTRLILDVISVMIVVNSVATYPLLMQPVITALQNTLYAGVPWAIGTRYTRHLIAVGLNVLVLVVSVWIPSFQLIMTVLGSAFSTLIVVVLPCICHMIIIKDTSVKFKILLGSVAAAGLAIGVLGTLSALSLVV
ncbi:MAG: hypothetical protein SGCHY_004274 [Lobulomycetales sp.]